METAKAVCPVRTRSIKETLFPESRHYVKKIANAVVKVLDLDVPESVEIGSTDEIVMVCNFVASKDEAAEMKWFYNGNIEQIYQWIPDSDKPPGAIGRFKERLDVTYSSPDPRAKYNSLKIKNVSYDLSGNYTCKISGIKSEDSQTKQLIVYSPPKSDLEIILFKNENLVICTVSGIYPMPKLDFYIVDGNDTRNIDEEIESDSDEDGFNITARYRFDNTSLSNPTTFLCNLTIPGTDYNLYKELDYYIEDEGVIEDEDYTDWLTSNETSDEAQNITMKDSSGIANHPRLYASLLLLLTFLLLS
nr:unnamed protein product [Callosobruchus chinensis]